MAFNFIPFSGDLDTLNVWMKDTFDRFARSQELDRRVLTYTAAPLNPYEGQIVIADGTSWNPGSGGGFYGYHGGSWNFLG